MTKGITLQEASRRYAKRSLMAFLDGKKNLNWLKGVAVAGTSSKDAFVQIAEELRGQRYGSVERWAELDSWLAEMA